jgi:hypothetical protein
LFSRKHLKITVAKYGHRFWRPIRRNHQTKEPEGKNRKSPYIIMVAIELRIASIFHASQGILLVEGGGNTVGCDDTSGTPLSDCLSLIPKY